MKSKLILLCLSVTLISQTFDEYKKSEENAYQSFKQDFDNLIDYLDRESIEYEKLKNEIYLIWGDQRLPTSKVWTAYSKDKSHRISIDYDKKQTTIQIQKKQSIPQTKSQAEQFLKSISSSLKKEHSKSSAIKEIVPKFSENDISIKKSKNNREIYEIKLPFRKSSFNQLVLNVLPFVKKYSTKYSLDPRRVLAQIHAESAFNPRAASYANAYGLMQLVPTSGGKEAYSFLLGKSANPQKSLLFDPEKNIELGCTYIHILNTKYFEQIDDNTTREYLTISAYNTGPGNVYRSYNERKKSDRLFKRINSNSSKENFEHLINYLPHRETRQYLQTVLQKKKLYTKL